MTPNLSDLFDRLVAINGSHPSVPKLFQVFQRYPILRPYGRKAFELGWGTVVTAFCVKLHGQVMKHRWDRSTEFESNEFWDCLNDGWMRQYIYPFDNIYNSQPSKERLSRLGPSSFRGWIQLPTDAEIEDSESDVMTIQMHMDKGYSFNLEFKPVVPSDEDEFADDYEEDNDYELQEDEEAMA